MHFSSMSCQMSAMKATWRLLDTGVLSGAENMALDKTLVTVRGRNESPNTVRFLMFSPAVALTGVYQDAHQELRLDYCREQGIDINRRITGGGALLFDEIQLGWELIAGLDDFGVHPMSQAFHRQICQCCVEGLRELGIEAQFRPRNDVEVNGRKISGTGGVEDGKGFLFQGTLLLDFDVSTMIKALRIPTEKLKHSSLKSAEERVTWVKRELGHLPPLDAVKAAMARGFEKVFDMRLEPGELLPVEVEEFQKNLPHFQSDEWVYGKRRFGSDVRFISGLHRCEAATIRAHLSIDVQRRELRSALITGDMLLSPERTILDLEARLNGARLDYEKVASIVEDYWASANPSAAGIGPSDINKAIRAAFDKLQLLEHDFSLYEIEKLLPVNGEPGEILSQKIDLVLLPYCAKLPGCSYRQTDDCAMCGACSYGEVHEACVDAGMRPVTILNFEHLMETLKAEAAKGARGYIGSCCEAFYHKHYEDFARSGLPGILVDVSRSTCYDLNKQRQAYLGDFEGQTDMDLGLIKKLIRRCARSAEK